MCVGRLSVERRTAMGDRSTGAEHGILRFRSAVSPQFVNRIEALEMLGIDVVHSLHFFNP